jgi:hypothetical protein
MSTFAILVGIAGAVALLFGLMQRAKAGRVGRAPFVKTGDAAGQGASAAGEKGAISVEGNVVSAEPIRSPLGNVECLYYEAVIQAVWQDGQTRHTRDLVKQRQAARFAVDDGSGAVQIDAGSGGDLPLSTSFDAWKEPGFVGFGSEIVVGALRAPTHNLPPSARYHATERAMPPQGRLFVCGRILDGNAIGAPDWSSLILSPQSRDELLGGAQRMARMALIGGACAVALGAVLGLLSKI